MHTKTYGRYEPRPQNLHLFLDYRSGNHRSVFGGIATGGFVRIGRRFSTSETESLKLAEKRFFEHLRGRGFPSKVIVQGWTRAHHALRRQRKRKQLCPVTNLSLRAPPHTRVNMNRLLALLRRHISLATSQPGMMPSNVSVMRTLTIRAAHGKCCRITRRSSMATLSDNNPRLALPYGVKQQVA